MSLFGSLNKPAGQSVFGGNQSTTSAFGQTNAQTNVSYAVHTVLDAAFPAPRAQEYLQNSPQLTQASSSNNSNNNNNNHPSSSNNLNRT
jgi:hypothetical protein